MDLVLVANSASGSGTDVGRVERLLGAHAARVRSVELEEVDRWLTGADGKVAARLVAGADRVVVAGGDGSIGPTAALAAATGTPLAVVPTGTANDFARHLGLPLEIEAAAEVAADGGAARRSVDLAWADEVPFLNAASAGLSVDAARRAAPLKPKLGPLAYIVAALGAGARGEPLRCRVECDGETRFEGEAWQVTVASTGAFGAGSEIEAADPEDGRLDVAIMKAGPRPRLLRHAVGLRTGRLTDQPGVEHLRGREVVVAGPTKWNVDGDERTLGGTPPNDISQTSESRSVGDVVSGGARFRVERAAVEVVVGG